MILDVLLYMYTVNGENAPGEYPYYTQEVYDVNRPPETNWIRMTSEEYDQYIANPELQEKYLIWQQELFNKKIEEAKKIVIANTEFGQNLIIEFSCFNANDTSITEAEILEQMQLFGPISQLLQQGAINTALIALLSMDIDPEFPQKYKQVLQYFITKIQTYLGI